MRFTTTSLLLLLVSAACVERPTAASTEPEMSGAYVADVPVAQTLHVLAGDSIQVSAGTAASRVRVIRWTPVNLPAGTVNATGLAVARAPGELIAALAGAGFVYNVKLVVHPITDVARIVVSAPKSTFVVGETMVLGATAYAADGSRISGPLPQWSVAQGMALSLTADGKATALRNGRSVTRAVRGARMDTLVLDVTGGPVDPTTPPPPPQSVLAQLSVQVLSGTAATVNVSSGVPMAKGRLRPSDVDGVRLLVGGTEVARYAEALSGVHADGSIRSLLLQFDIPLSQVAQPVQLVINGRTLPVKARVTPTAVPTAVVTYSTPADLIATGMFGPTVARSAAPTSPSYFFQYESNWVAMETHHFNTWNATLHPADLNFYDRVLAYFGFWARTGNPIYFSRGATLARRFIAEYVRPADYQLPEWTADLEGLSLHYWLTGDTVSRNAVIQAMGGLDNYRGGDRMANWRDHPWMDNRVQKAVLASKLLSLKLGATSTPGYGNTNPAIPDIRARAKLDVNRILSTQQANGGYIFGTCTGVNNFMTGMVNQALAEYYEEVEEDARVLDAVRRSYAWLRSTQWNATDRLFRYTTRTCPEDGDVTRTANDLNGLFLDGLGWLYRKTGDPALREWGDQIFQGGVEKTWLEGPKMFNQQYRSSWRWLGYRTGPA